jgi:DNA-binding transcriptional LysR family regulator
VTLEELVSGGGLAHDVDVHVGRPPNIPAGCRSRALFHEEFVCVTKRTTKKTGARMTLREYQAASHVRIRVLDARDPIDVALRERGVTRNIAVTIPHFSLAPFVVLETGYVATLSARLARRYASVFPLTVRATPFALPPRPVEMLWHERTDRDPGARFFRELVVETSRSQ